LGSGGRRRGVADEKPVDELNLGPAFPGGVPEEYRDEGFVKYVREQRVRGGNKAEAEAAHAAYRRREWSRKRFGGG